MTKADEAKTWALSRVGCPYIYGGTGQVCTPSYREARAKQYPAYQTKIFNNCPRLKGSATSCTNCKWCDPETGKGKRAYDCAQLVRWCMDYIGISMVSGANSQWQKTNWEAAGEIGSMPRNKVCLLYRYDDDKKKMGHTGIYLGDGYIVHAKGHDYGVVKELLGNPKFTHWGIPVGLYDEIDVNQTLKNGDQGVLVRELQTLLKQYGHTITVDGKFGPKTENVLKAYQAANGLISDGVCGPDTWASLRKTQSTEPPADSDEPSDDLNYNVSIEDISQLMDHIQAAYNILSKYVLNDEE